MSNNGKQGEIIFKQIMKDRGYIVEDVSSNSLYWDKDIDFLVTSPTSGLTKSFECKWDSRINQTENLYLELTNIHSKQWNGEGWYKHCEADYIAYGDAKKHLFFIIPLADLRERVKQLPQKIVNCGLDSRGLLVSLRDIQDIVKIL